MVQPTSGCAAERTDAVGHLIEHIQPDDGLAAIQGGTQRGVIGEAEVVAEPDDGGGRHLLILAADG